MFSRELVNGQVAGFPQFKLNGLNHDYAIKGGEFNIGDDLLNAFRDFALKFYKDNPDYGVTPAMIDENKVWVRKQLRQEVLVAAFGNDKAQQGMADLDLPLQRAIAEMPAAADLAQRAWKRNTGLNRSKSREFIFTSQ